MDDNHSTEKKPQQRITEKLENVYIYKREKEALI